MRFIASLLIAISLSGLNSCERASSVSSLMSSNNQNLMSQDYVPDFFVIISKEPEVKEEPSNCRENIAKVACLVDPISGEGIPGNIERPCLEGSEKYAKPFEDLHDHFPPALQKMFCSLTHIYIEKSVVGTAYAGTILNESGDILGAQMGIRQSVIDEDLNLSTWASWKEQLNFGGVTQSFTLTEGMPQHITSTDGDVSDFLYFVVAHEFGHIFDFANNLNATDPACEGDACPFAKASWGELSWESPQLANAENDFMDRTGLCFYWCETNTINLDRVPQLYRDLQRSNFISTYAASNPWDDFADSLAYFSTQHYLQTKYAIDTKQDAKYDIMRKLKSENFRSKREYIQRFLRSEINYP